MLRMVPNASINGDAVSIYWVTAELTLSMQTSQSREELDAYVVLITQWAAADMQLGRRNEAGKGFKDGRIDVAAQE